MMDRTNKDSALQLSVRSMGEGASVCGADEQILNPQIPNPKSQIVNHQSVHTLHSNCVLSFDVDKPRSIVREFYGKAAEAASGGVMLSDQEFSGRYPPYPSGSLG